LGYSDLWAMEHFRVKIRLTLSLLNFNSVTLLALNCQQRPLTISSSISFIFWTVVILDLDGFCWRNLKYLSGFLFTEFSDQQPNQTSTSPYALPNSSLLSTPIFTSRRVLPGCQTRPLTFFVHLTYLFVPTCLAWDVLPQRWFVETGGSPRPQGAKALPISSSILLNDFKFDFIDTREFHSKSFGIRMRSNLL
jgi:hypothetical protein